MTRIRAASAALLFCGVAPSAAQQVVDRIVAVVDKEVILESELLERVNFLSFQNRLDPKQPELRMQVLNDMISEKLLLAQAILDSIEIKDDEVTRLLDEQVERIVRQAGSEKRVEEYYGMPISRLKRENRAEMRKALLVQRVRQTREASITVSRREVEEFYEQMRDSLPPVPDEFDLSHIVIEPKLDSLTALSVQAKLRSILDSIKAGGDFADFAKRYSEDNTASVGGLLGWVRRGTFVPEFEAALFALQEGGVSDVVKTQFGYHVIQLVERRGEQVLARHILLRADRSAASDSAAVKELRALRERALAGESFAELAKKYSQDEDTKPFGGDLGRLSTDQIPQDILPIVTSLQEGEISQPHSLTVGRTVKFQILLLKKKIPAHPMNLQDDYRRIEQYALMFKKNDDLRRWIEGMKKTIYWEIRL